MTYTSSGKIPAKIKEGTNFNVLALILILTGIVFQTAPCQDIAYTRSVIGNLCAENMHGRGYVKNGDHRAAGYIKHELEANGVRPLGNKFYQFFPVDVNIFPGQVTVDINGRLLVPGRDYLIDPASPGLSGRFVPVIIMASEVLNGHAGLLFKKAEGAAVLLDSRELRQDKPEERKRLNDEVRRICRSNPYNLKALVEISSAKLIFGVASRPSAIPHILLNSTGIPDSVKSIRINIKNRNLTGYKTQNVIGYIPGTVCPDSFLVFTAHYDHLGMMGKDIYFPGANDNASGVAMLLNLSRYFSKNPQRFSVVFISFSAEEMGLLGSVYFTENPLIRLSSVKFLINLDLVGTGVDGIMVVNAQEFPEYYGKLITGNENGRFVPDIRKRGAACNSDQCPFYNKGIPGFFIYTLGGIAAYHDVNDRPETLPLTAFEGLTRLLISFAGDF